MGTAPSPRLILLCGLPGSGKTTLAKRLVSQIPAVRLCPDEWMAQLQVDLFDEELRGRLEELFWGHAQKLLRLGQSVVLEYGFWGRSERDEKRTAARAMGVGVELRYLAVPFEELCRRLAARGEDGTPGTVPVSRELLKEYARVFQAPDPEELALFDRPSL
ncbi:AAA family ATPase [Streptomyces sp. NPDC047072]|uniref:AAA family ATPase n=1 Tax=Streptomyces sp. NPDC047072 TaxID=3154809 RepID=UPI0033F8D3DC